MVISSEAECLPPNQAYVGPAGTCATPECKRHTINDPGGFGRQDTNPLFRLPLSKRISRSQSDPGRSQRWNQPPRRCNPATSCLCAALANVLLPASHRAITGVPNACHFSRPGG